MGVHTYERVALQIADGCTIFGNQISVNSLTKTHISLMIMIFISDINEYSKGEF